MFKKPLAILLSTLMATAAILGVSAPAQSTTPVDVDGVAFDFNTVLPFASGVTAGVSMGKVHLATTANIADFTNPGLIDGVSPSAGKDILVKDQTNQTQNGIYEVTGSGSLVRHADFDAQGEIQQGGHVFVDEGNINEHTGWIQQTVLPTPGTDNIVFQRGLWQLDGDTHPDVGENIAVSSVVNYINVANAGGAIGARITYLGQYGVETNNTAGVLNKLDDAESATGANRFVRPSVEWDPAENAEDRYAEFKVEFFRNIASTPVAVTLANLELSVYDVDNFQTIEITGEPNYELASQTILNVNRIPGTSTLKVTSAVDDAERDLTNEPPGTPSSFSQARVSFKFNTVASFTFKLGLPKEINDPSSSFDLDFGPGASWGNRAIDIPAALPFASAPLTNSVSSAPYEGPVLGSFSDRTLDPCTPKSITITGTKLYGAAGSIQGKAVTVLENTDTKLVIATPAGLTPARGVDLVITSPYGTLTHQNAFDIPAGVCSQTLSKGRWTQIQSDGKTVKFYAKDPIGDGKIQFFVDGKELAWITAVDATDPKLSFASSFPYLVRSVDLKAGKNRFEIRVDGKRVWRATYVPRG